MTRPVLHLLGPSTGGIRRHVAVVAAAAAESGRSVRVAGPAGVMDGLGIEQVEVPVGSIRRLPSAIRRLRALVGSGDPIVHAHGLTAGWTAVLAGLGDRTVLTVHNLVLDEAAGRSARILRRLEKILPGRVARTIAISDQIREHLDPDGDSSKIHVVPPVGPMPRVREGTEQVREDLGIGPDRPLVVAVGRLHPQKNLDLLIEVAGRITDASFVVVGEGPERDRLEAMIRSRPEADIRLVGARPDAADHLAAADVVVSSARWEGFGLVIAEALTLARPVVATDVGPVHTMVIDEVTGLLVPPENPDALEAGIRRLLADRVFAARLGEAGRTHMYENFSPEALIRRIDDVYLEVSAHP